MHMELQRRCDKIVRSIESEKDPEKRAAIITKQRKFVYTCDTYNTQKIFSTQVIVIELICFFNQKVVYHRFLF